MGFRRIFDDIRNYITNYRPNVMLIHWTQYATVTMRLTSSRCLLSVTIGNHEQLGLEWLMNVETF